VATRAAAAAIWRRAAVGRDAGLRFVPPVLAVEVAGRDEREPALRDKARWYLGVGVPLVWLVLPEEREVVVVTAAGESRHGRGERLPADPRLPHLAPAVDDLFFQISRTG
jgi:Uma2 family endonuclease